MAIPAAVDVLVVGAGPTGLMLATQLARRGLRPLVIDRQPGPSLQTKALGVQARTLEIYAQLGIVERALALGTRGTGAHMWVGGRRRAHVPLSDIGRDLSPYPYLLILGQDDNERLLGADLRARGVEVRWSTELVGLAQSPASVTATLRQPDGSAAVVEAAWVAGCDGSRSAVRELSGIPFPGAAYEHVFFVADTEARGPMVPATLNVFLWSRGFQLFFPMRGTDHWRIVGILPEALRERGDLAFEEVAPAIREQVAAPLEIRACHWFSVYRIHHRRAQRFREGRCFLLGDAAHVHSPVGAQGMNTGLQDAYNLAWKLALVLQGRAQAALLDSYAAERERVAQQLLQTTDRAFSIIVSGGRVAGFLRTQLMPRALAFAMRRRYMRRLGFRMISQTGIRYRGSALSQPAAGLPAEAPQPGDRFPWLRLRLAPGEPVTDLHARLDDTRFALLAFGQPAPALPPSLPAAGLIDVLAIAGDGDNDAALAAAGVPCPSFWLLRPDGHVGLAGGRLEPGTLARYLAERVTLVR